MLVPQIFNAQRFDCRPDHVPQVMRVFDACMKLDAFEKTRPEACPDAVLTPQCRARAGMLRPQWAAPPGVGAVHEPARRRRQRWRPGTA